MLRQGMISLQLGGSVLLVSYGQIKANPTSASKMEHRRGVAVADFVIICHLVDGHDRSLLGRVNTSENNSRVLRASHRRVLDQYQLELKYLTDSICNVKVEDGWSGHLERIDLPFGALSDC